MYIQHHKQIPKNNHTDLFPEEIPEYSAELTKTEEQKLSEQYSKNAFLHWNAPEFEMYEQNKKRLSYFALVLLAIIVYATFTNNPIMAIVFVLIGIVSYMYSGKEARILTFQIAIIILQCFRRTIFFYF